MNSVQSLNKGARDYFHGKYESRLIIQQDRLCLRLQDAANEFKGLQPELAQLTFQQIQSHQGWMDEYKADWIMIPFFHRNHRVQHHSTLCLAAWRVGLWKRSGAAAWTHLKNWSFCKIKKIIWNKEQGSFGDSGQRYEKAERESEGGRVGGWRYTATASGWNCPGPQAKGWWHHKRGKISWKVTSLETAKQIQKKNIQLPWRLNAVSTNLNKQQQMCHQRRNHTF